MSKSDYCYRFFNEDEKNGILACGHISISPVNDLTSNIQNEYYSCSILLSGSGIFKSSKGEEYILSSGMVFQKFPGESYTLTINTGQEWQEFAINIGCSVFDALKSLNLLYVLAPVFKIKLLPYLEEWMPVLLGQLKNSTPEILSETLFNMQKFIVSIHKEGLSGSNQDIKAVIESSKQLLFYQFKESISLKNIAASYGMSYEKYRKMFKKELGVSPIQFHLQCKFLVARRLITEGLPIKIVAEEVGYSDPFIFSRQFKKYTGVSPSYYKKH